ncbi:MAG: hypothetical protein ACI4PU_08230 [Intestinibacter sp.]
MPKTKRDDLAGQTFNKWEVIEYDYTNKYGNAYWKCRCECGTIKSVMGYTLKNGKSKSCGCLRKKAKKEAYNANKRIANKGERTNPFALGEPRGIRLKERYKRKGGKVKQYRLSPAELEKYLAELQTKEVQYRCARG